MSSSDMKKEGWPVMKKIKFAMAAFLFAAVALFLFHNLPRTAVVQISGTDVKRVDRESGEVVSKNAQDTSARGVGNTYDVRFINSVARNGKTMVFRNEDTGWGWPPYFKFNSADLTAQRLHNALADRQSDTRSRNLVLGIQSLEHLKNPLVMPGGHSDAVISNTKLPVGFFFDAVDMDLGR